MIDLVVMQVANVVSAVSPGSAAVIATVPAGNALKSLSLDNGFNVDMIVQVGSHKSIYLRAGQLKVLDLSANRAGSGMPSSDLILSTYAANGVAPTVVDATSILIMDCAF
jgi:hypothetical protein